jgi:hypothetical protein
MTGQACTKTESEMTENLSNPSHVLKLMGVLENVLRYDNAPQTQGTDFDNKTLECSCMAWHACMVLYKRSIDLKLNHGCIIY